VTGKQSEIGKRAGRPTADTAKLAQIQRPAGIERKEHLLRSTTRSLAVTACVLLALALSGVAAGSTQDATPKQWVSTLCGSLLTWEQTVKKEFAQLNTTVVTLKKSGNADPKRAKSELVTFLGRIVGSTNTLVGKLRAVGAPSMQNGDKLQNAILTGLGQVNKAFKDAKKAAQKLPTGSRKQFTLAAQRLGTTVKASVTRANAALSGLAKYDTPELDQAFKDDPACKKLG